MEKENYEILWEQVFLPEIERSVSSIAFATYIKQLKPIDLNGDKLVLSASTKFFADTVNDKAVGGKIREALLKCNTYVTDFYAVVAKDREEYLNQLKAE